MRNPNRSSNRCPSCGIARTTVGDRCPTCGHVDGSVVVVEHGAPPRPRHDAGHGPSRRRGAYLGASLAFVMGLLVGSAGMTVGAASSGAPHPEAESNEPAAAALPPPHGTISACLAMGTPDAIDQCIDRWWPSPVTVAEPAGESTRQPATSVDDRGKPVR